MHFIRGAGLRRIWEDIEYDILLSNEKLDIVIIYAGVCDITDYHFDRRGRHTVIPPFNMDHRFIDIESCMNDIASNFRMINPSGKLFFLQESGIDVIRYNRIPEPIPASYLIMQASLENNLRVLQKFTKKLNDRLMIPTPWSLEVTNAFRNNKWIPIYVQLTVYIPR